MFQISNLDLIIDNKKLISNLSLQINPGEIHVLMGKNGVGKSSIAKAIMGDDNYKVKGSIKYNGEDLTNLDISERAKRGIYLLNQTPMQIEGVSNAEMLRMALSERVEKPINIFEFSKELDKICESLDLDKSFIHKDINVGCSGGERKKIELLHLWVLKPSFIILDEVDSGLDVDAIKVVANSLKKYYELYHPSILIITHNNNLIKNFKDYQVHLLWNGQIVKNGGPELAQEIFNKGFKEIEENDNKSDTFVISEN